MAGRHVSEDEVRALCAPTDPGRPLGFVYLCDLEEEPSWRATSFVVRVRRGGFLAALPQEQRVCDLLLRFVEGDADTVFYREATVAGETPRRRPVGDVAVYLADFPWRFLPFFRRAVAGRAAGPELLPMTLDGVTVRPIRAPLESIVEAWIGEVVDDPAFAEYVTAESAPGTDGEGEDRESTPGPPAPQAATTASGEARLLARVRDLEAQLRSTAAVPPAPAPLGDGRRRARGLFDDAGDPPGTGLSAGDWATLREAAGPAPGRMAMHERAARPDTVLEDTNLAEVEAGAIEDGMPVGTGDGTASLQQLILAQTQVLAKLAQPKAVDPLSAALANMTKEENFLGAKGSAARDAYIKVLSDNRATATAVRKMGAEAMGLPADNVPANLMLDYVERKMPVGDQKMLAMIASFAASGWRAARDEGNISLEGWMAKLLVFCDQSSVEGGRTQLPWLLTGLSDPNFAAMNRRRQGIRPFGRLIPSAWMSANLAYIKEMDFLGARISGASSSYDTGLHDPPAAPPPVEDDHPQPKKPPRRPPRKPRGTGSES